MSITKQQQIEICKAFVSKYIDYYEDRSYYNADYTPFKKPSIPVGVAYGSKPGDVVCGSYDNGFYITILSKVGNVTLYNSHATDPVQWVCDASYSICQSAKDAGFGETTGEIQSVKQLQHIFLIADSYK